MKGFAILNHGIAYGFRSSHFFSFVQDNIVSPTFASLTDFNPVTMYPICPVVSFLSALYLGLKYQTSVGIIFD